jgi:hypothetical protein
VYLVGNVTKLFRIDGILEVQILILEIKLGFGFSFGSIYLGLKLMINPWFYIIFPLKCFFEKFKIWFYKWVCTLILFPKLDLVLISILVSKSNLEPTLLTSQIGLLPNINPNKQI